jgi:hypothetical protein
VTKGDPLDDWLSSQPAKVHLRSKRLIVVIREAYPIGVPAFIVKSQTDLLGTSGGYSFHLGTPDDVLRRICSWLLTHGEVKVLSQVIVDLWKRHGREDVALAALLLANLQDGVDVWARLATVIESSSTAESLLLSIEECFRANHAPPREDMLLEWCSMSAAHAHLALLTQHANWIRSERPPLSSSLKSILESIPYPDGDSLLGRVRDQMLNS